MIVPPAPRQVHILAHAGKVGSINEIAEQKGEDDCAASFGISGKPDLDVLVFLLGKATVGHNNSF